jgi:transposase InsO family protein
MSRTKASIKATTGGPSIEGQQDIDPCTACIKGKLHHLPIPKSKQIKELRNNTFRTVHTDWWGPYPHPGMNGEQYLQVFIDEVSGYSGVFASKTPADGATNLSNYIAHLELITNNSLQVRIVQSDSATVYTAGEFAKLCRDNNIAQRVSAPYSQAQNGRAERFWRTMENQVAAMFAYSHMVPLQYWVYAILYFTHVHNRTCASEQTLTPVELLTGKKPDISHFRTWGCPAHAYVEKANRDKFESKAQPGINLGHCPITKDAYYIYFPDSTILFAQRAM